MEEKKVTIRFESSAANPLVEDDILMSGPVELFAVLDELEELQDDELITEVQSEIDKGRYNPIVYVKNVTNEADSSRYRGAYFRYDDIIEGEAIWTEILLGTHSHKNIEMLEKLSGINIPENAEASVMVLKTDGTLGFEALPSGLPELPDYIKDKLKDREEVSVNEPEFSEDKHLDASLSLLGNSHIYDSEGNLVEVREVSNCIALYRALVRDGKYLVLNPTDFSLKIDDSNENLYLKMGVDLINFDITNNQENVIHPLVKGNAYYFNVNLPDKVSVRDRVFIFCDSNFIEKKYYTESIDAEEKKASYAISKLCPLVQDSDLHKFTVVIVKNCTDVEFFESEFAVEMSSEEPRITLDMINNKLNQAYIEGELSKKPIVPHLYLATDENGNIHWENTLVPAQTFYAESKNILVNEQILVDGKVKVSFDKTYYHVDDFLLLIVNNIIDFTTEREVVEKENRINFYFKPKDLYDVDEDNSPITNTISLIIIRNSSKESVAEEMHATFLTREEAVSILTRSTINLSDYVKRSELGKFSRVGHKHSEYATVDHNHDYRYANFHHTHPELYATIIKILGSVDENGVIDENILNEWITKLQDSEKDAFYSILEEIGFKKDAGRDVYYIDDVKVRLSSDLIDRINSEIELYPDFGTKLNPDATVSDALAALTELFKHDTVKATQVFLSENIKVKHPIGGVVEGKLYKKPDLENGEAGTTLEEIIMDILNPYWDIKKVREEMTPVKEFTTLSFYKPIYNQEGNIVDFLLLEEGKMVNTVDNPGNDVLYFAIEPRNKNNGECKAMTVVDNVDIIQTIDTKVTLVKLGEEYDPDIKEFNHKKLYRLGADDEQIIIEWFATEFNDEEYDRIYDNYGFEHDTLNTDDTTPIVIEQLQDIFETEYPDLIIGATDTVDHITKTDAFGNSIILTEAAQKKLLMKGDTVPLDITVGSHTCVIFALYEESENLSFDIDISIIEKMSGMEIKYFFTTDEQHEMITLYDQNYLVRYYEITTDVIPEINLIFKVKGE